MIYPKALAVVVPFQSPLPTKKSLLDFTKLKIDFALLALANLLLPPFTSFSSPLLRLSAPSLKETSFVDHSFILLIPHVYCSLSPSSLASEGISYTPSFIDSLAYFFTLSLPVFSHSVALSTEDTLIYFSCSHPSIH